MTTQPKPKPAALAAQDKTRNNRLLRTLRDWLREGRPFRAVLVFDGRKLSLRLVGPEV